jgi:hypothetical protein
VSGNIWRGKRRGGSLHQSTPVSTPVGVQILGFEVDRLPLLDGRYTLYKVSEIIQPSVLTEDEWTSVNYHV